jgi:hypothetical protein
VAPFWRAQIAFDRVRLAEMEALRDGREPAPRDGGLHLLAVHAGEDPVLLRAVVEQALCLDTADAILARPEVVSRLEGLGPAPAAADRSGPDRARLVELLAG